MLKTTHYLPSTMATFPNPKDMRNTCFSPKELYKDILINGSTPRPYVRSDQEPPSIRLKPCSTLLDPSNHSIPTIDMHQLVADQQRNGNKGDKNSSDRLEELHLACINWGFFVLVNHGIDHRLLSKLKLETEEFFKLPLEEKAKFKVTPGETEGYGPSQRSPFQEDQKLDWCDRFFLHTNPLSLRNPHLFAMLPPSFRETLEEYLEELQKLAMKLVGFMGRALKMEEGEMERMFDDAMHSTKITYYPPHPTPEKVLGITPHSDADVITVLFQVNGVGGLEVKMDGRWVAVDVPPGAFVVNIGDLMEVVTNGVYKSAEHRVIVNSEKERMSIATFFNLNLEAEIGPSSSLVGPENPPRFRTLAVREHMRDYFYTKLDGKSYLEKMRIGPDA